MDTVHRPAGRPGTRGSGKWFTNRTLSRAGGFQLGLGPGRSPSGLVAQLVEHPLCKRGASGSNPDESMGAIPTWTSKESPPNHLQPTRPDGLRERLGDPERHRTLRLTRETVAGRR